MDGNDARGNIRNFRLTGLRILDLGPLFQGPKASREKIDSQTVPLLEADFSLSRQQVARFGQVEA